MDTRQPKEWIKPKVCDSAACTEFSFEEDGTVLLRDGKQGDASPRLPFTPEELDAFAVDWVLRRDLGAAVLAGELG